jgi:hypothetical protein
MFIPDPGYWIWIFLLLVPDPVPDPGSRGKKAPDPGYESKSATLVTTNKMAGGGSRFLEKSSGTAVLGPLYICAKIELFQRTG